jgi:hypothetical protein
LKLAGSLALVCATVLASLPGLSPSAAAQDLQRDDIAVAQGQYFREDIFLPADGSIWQVTAVVLNNTSRIDLYIVRTTDLVFGYPDSAFSPLETRENVSYASILWRPDSRREAFSLIVDNLDNSRPSDARPTGEVHVRLVRSPPLHTNPEATAALGAGTSVCAAGLALGAVGLAVYLKRRPRPETDEVALADVPRIEVPVDVPPRPRGVWKEQDPEELEP